MREYRAEVEVITPEIAKAYLGLMGANRKLKKGDVGKYVHDMRDNDWVEDGATIRFDEDGVLFDGQHRLIAIIESGIPQKIIVARGCDRRGRLTCDTGVKRSTADILTIFGVPAANHCSAIVNRYFNLRYKRAFVRGAKKNEVASVATAMSISDTDRCNEYVEHADMYKEVRKMAGRCVDSLRLHLSVAEIGGIAAYLIRDMRYEYKTVETFFIDLHDLKRNENSAIYALRKALLRDAQRKNSGLKFQYKQAIIIKAWNAYASHADVKILRYNEDREGKVWFLTQYEAAILAAKQRAL